MDAICARNLQVVATVSSQGFFAIPLQAHLIQHRHTLWPEAKSLILLYLLWRERERAVCEPFVGQLTGVAIDTVCWILRAKRLRSG